MNGYRLQLVAAKVRSELLARGTEVPRLAEDERLVRKQLNVWMGLLQQTQPTKVMVAKTLVIPLKEDAD